MWSWYVYNYNIMILNLCDSEPFQVAVRSCLYSVSSFRANICLEIRDAKWSLPDEAHLSVLCRAVWNIIRDPNSVNYIL